MVDFIDMFYDLEGSGFYEIALPFILVFAVIFAVLEKVEIFGSNGKKFNVIIGLVAGFLIIRNEIFIEFMNDIIARFSVILIVILAFLIIFGIFGSKAESWSKGVFALGIIAALIAGIFVLSERMGYYDITGTSDFEDFYDEYNGIIWIIIFLFVIGGIIIFSGKGETVDKAFGRPSSGGG